MYTLLIATADAGAREFLAAQLDADGHTVHEADSAAALTAKLTAHAIDALILGDLGRPADAILLVRELRAGRLHTRVHPAQPVITLGASDEFSTLRAYEAGSDHHLARDSGYLVFAGRDRRPRRARAARRRQPSRPRRRAAHRPQGQPTSTAPR